MHFVNNLPLHLARVFDAFPYSRTSNMRAGEKLLQRMKLEANLRTTLGRRAGPDDRQCFEVPLSWAATTANHPDANLGDALSAVIVAAMAGIPVRHVNFDEPCERLVSTGTIGHGQKFGTLHFWGTGVDARRNPVNPSVASYIKPPRTKFVIHALRGRGSASTFRAAGIKVPDIFGDPVWFLPRLFPRGSAITAELGVVVHITELDEQRAEASPQKKYRRYEIPPNLSSSIRIINTFTKPSVASLRAKVDEITSCRRILSTSLHGLVIAEAYGIPCAWFGTNSGGAQLIDINATTTSLIDHRVWDFYSGAASHSVLAYCQKRSETTDWDTCLKVLDTQWTPSRYDGKEFFDAFPLPIRVQYADRQWPLDATVISEIRF